jgi:hypothetical protein
VLLGSQMTVKLPERGLRIALAVTLGLSGIKLLEPPGANVIVVSAAVIAAVVGLAAVARRLVRPAPRPVAERGID